MVDPNPGDLCMARMNAGGMPYTCKSNGNAGQPGDEWRTGEYRIGTCPVVGDSPAKAGLIPHTTQGESGGSQDLALLERPMSD